MRRRRRGCSRPPSRIPASSTCCATSSRCSTPTRRSATHANQLAFRLKLLLAAGLAPQLAACASCGEAEHLVGFSGAAGGVVCSACEASGFPLGEEAHAFMVGALGAPLAEAPERRRRGRCARPSARSPRPLEHHAHLRLRPRCRGIESAPWETRADGTKWVYDFAEGSREMRDLLGGKGANVAEMTRILGAERVPAGFTITTEACVAYMRRRARAARTGSTSRSTRRSRGWRRRPARRLGDADDPLLVSVRSGARESMPGMLDTVLNLGLNDESVEGLAERDRQRALRLGLLPALRADVRQRRARGSPASSFEDAIARGQARAGVKLDTELDVDALRELTPLQGDLHEATGEDFPQDPHEQLAQAIRAVFDSWTGERAVAYRRINRIPDDWGTAVNVQQMVFGNKGDTSGSGVAFSRDEVTGAPEPSGDFLINAQGEDVVSGVRNTATSPSCAT